ncbi:7543_t:CDS:2 [Diversispora eburnea]|uniref:7543_t:CDS:1 n=1 Tax=Diversispora eburnea TaxID=1213867 RepID=A0A9N8VCF5_9GLOM|nr:7543_t:CDS:2 [Diversispora eburnea]
MSTSTKKGSAPKLRNLYTHRTATSERPCFVCSKFTSAVLTTGDGLDWFYICTSHLNDSSFASPVVPVSEPVKTTIKHDDSTIIPKKEGEKEMKKKEEKDENKDENKDELTTKEKKEKQGDDKEKKDELKKEIKSPLISNHVPPLPPEPKQYILHRDIFYLRESCLIKKRQEKESQNLLKQLPNVPKTPL